MAKKRVSDAERKKNMKKNLQNTCILSNIGILYLCMLIGHGLYKNPNVVAITVIMDVLGKFPGNFWQILPTSLGSIFTAVVICALVDVVLYNSYLTKRDIAQNPHGDTAFEDDFLQYDKEFVIDPAIVEKVTGSKPKTFYDEEHKKIVTSPKIRDNLNDKVYRECWNNTQLYADQVALSLNGNWSQRNTNAIIFGGSGTGKSRFFLNPNLLQANSNYVVTDPSGEIMLGYGAFLQKEKGYIVKCLNVSDMEHSCRFNPLYYIRSEADIPIIAETLMENTKKSAKASSGDDFWPKTTQALLCCTIGYLYEVEPIERRNFYNVLEILNMARAKESDEDAETDFDLMFKLLGERNPDSYAYNQYLTVTTAPRKTLNNILISTAILLSTYINIREFKNLIYKDEMELDKIGAAPYKLREGATLFVEDEERYEERYNSGKLPKGYIDVEDFKKYADKDLLERNELGKYTEGDPYKVAIFLCIPTADTTYNWLTAMMYSIIFKMLYRRGETRAKEQVTTQPKLAFPARLLIDECANIGKIPNLQEYLATCRKYGISIVPIFQSFSQIEKVYGKEDANSIYANCDTTLFLGGVDSQTLKLVCERLGKETIKTLNHSRSKGKSGSTSENGQQIARDLMSRSQAEQMSNSECLVFIRGLKPFRVKKFNLNGHPNFKYTAEANPDEYSFVSPFFCKYDDEEIEYVRIKKQGEDGYNEPEEIESARLKANKRKASDERRDLAVSLQRSAHLYGKFDENAEYATESDRKQARMNHESYVDTLRKTYDDAVAAEDEYSMDVIRSTCVRYDIDIGIEFEDSPRQNVRARSAGIISADSAEGIETMKELTHEEALDRIKDSAFLGNSIYSSIFSEFDMSTMEQIAESLGCMVTDVEGKLNRIAAETNEISQEEKLYNGKDNSEAEEEARREAERKAKAEEERMRALEEQEANLAALDIDDDSSDEGIEDVWAKVITKEKSNAEAKAEEEEDPDSEFEGTIPTQEELEAATMMETDFSGVDEGEDDYSNSSSDDDGEFVGIISDSDEAVEEEVEKDKPEVQERAENEASEALSVENKDAEQEVVDNNSENNGVIEEGNNSEPVTDDKPSESDEAEEISSSMSESNEAEAEESNSESIEEGKATTEADEAIDAETEAEGAKSTIIEDKPKKVNRWAIPTDDDDDDEFGF